MLRSGQVCAPSNAAVDVLVERLLHNRLRDSKGLYRKARLGELSNFTGIDSPCEAPEQPELHVDTTLLQPEEAAEHILDFLTRAGVLTGA